MKVGVHQGSGLSPLLFAIIVNVVAQNVRKGVFNVLLLVADLVLMSKTPQDLKERF